MAGKIEGLRNVAQSAWRDALLAADPEEAVHRHFRVKGEVLQVGDIDYFLSRFERIYVLGAGKASARMALAVERVLGPRLTGGLVIAGRGSSGRPSRVLIREAGHPYPDDDGLHATEEMLELAASFGEKDLVVFVLSGGGSAMLADPMDGISITDLQRAHKLFFDSGMNIHEINTVRKHVSRVKGGRLAREIFPATTIALILSDVIGDRLDVIASGPMSPDPTTFQDAAEILERRAIWDKLPASVRDALRKGRDGDVPETPKMGSEVFSRVHHEIAGSNRLSLLAAENRAHRLGMNTMILSSSVCGESREIAAFYGALAREIRTYERPLKPPCCLIAGGETTVTIRGHGKGGRCQEMALAIARELADVPGSVFLAAGTDGVDGPTDAAGAYADSTTIARAKKLGLSPENFLAENDSYNFFRGLDDLIISGPTGTNVMDVHLLLVG